MPQCTGGKVFRATAWHGDEVLEVAGKSVDGIVSRGNKVDTGSKILKNAKKLDGNSEANKFAKEKGYKDAHEGLELDDAYASDSSGDSFWSKFADGVQAGLDIAGLVPGVGEIADGVNALISLGRGDVAGATLSAASMLPIVGGKGGKIARAAIKHGDEVLEVASCSPVTIKLPLANC